jgi:uncharacterized protein YoxC
MMLVVFISYTQNGLSKAKSAIEAVNTKMETLKKEQAVQDAALKQMPEWSMMMGRDASRPTSATEKQERVSSTALCLRNPSMFAIKIYRKNKRKWMPLTKQLSRIKSTPHPRRPLDRTQHGLIRKSSR